MERVFVEGTAIIVAMYRHEVAELLIKYIIKPLLHLLHIHLVKSEKDAAIWLHSLNKQLAKGKRP